MTACPAPKRIISPFPVSNRSLSIVAVKCERQGGLSEGNSCHFRPHRLFDWLHVNVDGKWSAHHTGLIRHHAPISDSYRKRTRVIAFANSTDATYFRLANPDETDAIDPAWWSDIQEGEYRTLLNTDIAVTRCALVKKDGSLLDVSPVESVQATLVGGGGSVSGCAREIAGLVWGREAVGFGALARYC